MKHCWHGTNITLTSNPPQHPQYCCRCGAGRNVTHYPIRALRKGHGKFLAETAVIGFEDSFYYTTPDTTDECPGDSGEKA